MTNYFKLFFEYMMTKYNYSKVDIANMTGLDENHIAHIMENAFNVELRGLSTICKSLIKTEEDNQLLYEILAVVQMETNSKYQSMKNLQDHGIDEDSDTNV